MSKAYIFVSKTIPSVSTVESTAIAFHSISADAADSEMYGIEFTLSAQTEIYLGWVADLTTTANLEFRAKEVALLQVLEPTDGYVAANAISAPESTDILLACSEFSRVYESSGTYSMLSDNTGYLIGASGGSLDLGVIDFGSGKYDKAFVSTAASSIANNATYDLFLDDGPTAFASVAAVKTASATSFAKSQAAIASISGVHKVTLKFNNHTSSLFSAGFANANTSAIKEIKLSDIYEIYASNNAIVVEGLNNSEVLLFTIDGLLVERKTAVKGSVKFGVRKGIYLVVIEGKGVKVVVD